MKLTAEALAKSVFMVRQAHHERKKVNKFNTTTARPEPFGSAQESLVEGLKPEVLQVSLPSLSNVYRDLIQCYEKK